MQINPGIVKVVQLLNDNGFTTTNYGYGYVVVVTQPESLISESNRLATLLRDNGVKLAPLGPEENLPYIQANYSPVDGYSFIEVSYITDKCLSQQGE